MNAQTEVYKKRKRKKRLFVWMQGLLKKLKAVVGAGLFRGK